MEQKIRRSEVEIMAPVGSYESLMAAIQAHADSIYFGVEKLNMRAGSSANFTLDDLARIVAIAREHGIKTYLTVNTILYDQDLEEMHRVLDRALAEGINAVIASDQAAGVDVQCGKCFGSSVSHDDGIFITGKWGVVIKLHFYSGDQCGVCFASDDPELTALFFDKAILMRHKDNACFRQSFSQKFKCFYRRVRIQSRRCFIHQE